MRRDGGCLASAVTPAVLGMTRHTSSQSECGPEFTAPTAIQEKKPTAASSLSSGLQWLHTCRCNCKTEDISRAICTTEEYVMHISLLYFIYQEKLCVCCVSPDALDTAQAKSLKGRRYECLSNSKHSFSSFH